MTGALVDAAGATHAPDAPDVPVVVRRARLVAICLGLTLLAFVQAPGRQVADTKLGVAVDPVHFLGRALHLWDPSTQFGQLQNQADGYLFPMGPFFLLGHAVGLPVWVVQRAWLAALLVVAFLGALRLLGVLGVGTASTRTVAAVAYALCPRAQSLLGPISAEALPLVLLPWTVVPLVLAATGRLGARRAAARSGVAVLAMGAVNASATLAVLVVPAMFVLTRPAGLRRRLAGWWALAVMLAVTWWAGPLVLLGRYSYRFLDYIETAATVTSTTSPAQVLLGNDHWLQYVAVAGRPWWPAGWSLATSSALIVEAAIVAGAGLAGLARRDAPERPWLLLSALAGFAAVTLGHAALPGVPWAEPLRSLLDGPLAPFRNVHKFDPVLRLPLAVGVAHMLSRVRLPAFRVGTSALRIPAAGLAALAVVGLAAPAVSGRLAPDGAYDGLPAWWHATAAWLDAHAASGDALVVPGAAFGEYTWGRPLDEPLQALAHRAGWAVRDAVPLGSAGSTRVMDVVDGVLADGRGDPHLAAYLARAGVAFLVVRNDLSPLAGAPPPVVVLAAVAGSPGLALVASFGPRGTTTGPGDQVPDMGLDVAYPAVEIYAVRAPVATVTAAPQSSLVTVGGGPDALLPLAGVVGDRPAVLAGDAASSAVAVVADTERRRVVDFGRGRDRAGATYAATSPPPAGRPASDYLPLGGAEHLTTARVLGGSVTASSSASDPGTPGQRIASAQPFAAVDGDPRTSWLSGSADGAVGQWLEVRSDRPLVSEVATVRLGIGSVLGRPVTRLRVDTDNGSTTVDVADTDAPQSVRLPAGVTRRVRLTVLAVAGGDVAGDRFAVRELAVPGLRLERTLVVPADTGASPPAAVSFARAPGTTTGCAGEGAGLRCSPTLSGFGEDVDALDRTWTLPAPATYRLALTARPDAGPALDATVDALLGDVRATASSTYVDDPRVRPGAALDGDPATAWVAGLGDAAPTLTLHWRRAVDIRGLRLVAPRGVVAARPITVQLRTGDGSAQVVPVASDGSVTLLPIRTDVLSIRVRVWEDRTLVDPVTGAGARLPPGIGDVVVAGARAPRSAELDLPCGAGPSVSLDGRRIETAAHASAADLLAGRDIALRLCGAAEVPLNAGVHRLRATTASGLLVQSALLIASPSALTGPGPTGPVATVGIRVERSTAETRVVTTGGGAASVVGLAQNSNDGWVATAGGRRLVPVRLDGWRQGWLVPAGAPTEISMRFAPDTAYRLLLVGGLLLAVVLVFGAVVGDRGDPAAGGVAGGGPPAGWWPVSLALVVAVGVAAGPLGVAVALVGLTAASRVPWWSPLVLATAAGASRAAAMHGLAGARVSADLLALAAISVACAASAAAPALRRRRTRGSPPPA